jgi:flagellar biosynthesis/type III secretory pathway chaperone
MIHEPSLVHSPLGLSWEDSLTRLLDELLETQREMLEILEQKRLAMVKRDLGKIRDLQPREESLCQRLQACQQQRDDLLALARSVNLPDSGLQALSRSLPLREAEALQEKLANASSRSRLLKHQSLTNWIIAQRNLLHITQLLEIVTSGGQSQPTYGRTASQSVGGFVLDQDA